MNYGTIATTPSIIGSPPRPSWSALDSQAQVEQYVLANFEKANEVPLGPNPLEIRVDKCGRKMMAVKHKDKTANCIVVPKVLEHLKVFSQRYCHAPNP